MPLKSINEQDDRWIGWVLLVIAIQIIIDNFIYERENSSHKHFIVVFVICERDIVENY